MKISEIVNKVLSKPYSAFFYTPPIYPNAKSFLFDKPSEILTIYGLNDFEPMLSKADKKIAKNLFGYATLNYELGYLFEQRLHKFLREDKPLAHLVFFNDKNVKEINSESIKLSAELNFIVSDFHLNTSKTEYINSIRKIKKYIADGDTYQINYTVKGKFNFEGDIASFLSNLIFNQSAKYIAIINLAEEIIISISPELFFETNLRNIITKPMKGTITRGVSYQDDQMKKHELENSIKNQAENVMIVDLLRNDLGRICEFGSVQSTKLFEIEKYESLYQMISTVKGKLKKSVKFSEIIKNIFPCGSVTGAPKIRTMEIIRELEKEERGIYTGAIGLMLGKNLVFNVAIRTIQFNREMKNGTIGLGSGVVWDSKPDKEYNEVLLKSNFLIKPEPYFEIFETARVENGEVTFLNDHLQRMKQAADYFLFNYDEKKIVKKINNELKTLDTKKVYRLKIILGKTGKVELQIQEFTQKKSVIKIILSKNKINSLNKFQYFKTTNRKLYDEEYNHYKAKGFFDVIYLNENENVSEGSITNIFIRKGNVIITPTLQCGILSGIYRKYFIRTHPETKEKRISLDDLLTADEIILTNSVRGVVKVDEFYLNEKEYVSYI
ncbi:4-amino-4-deoxychorismate lyase [Ignavibacterium album JCM 16511]|uniref:4-amino-4-deoxychorismate lyase n=1 Tax=Ignavibacterium album (strain DSM 19864 / JCM 16511 / NBRC 101810 / Mat9-16) TaxID=945713 RepID=I0AKD4_IGNAJ|nr:aminodeoxychorismate synthase component I [Ignavibacterium album]AFH49441.1 4-amino-4-deoxychorismate lyase [Ignavibacterium album JCM 16511]